MIVGSNLWVSVDSTGRGGAFEDRHRPSTGLSRNRGTLRPRRALGGGVRRFGGT